MHSAGRRVTWASRMTCTICVQINRKGVSTTVLRAILQASYFPPTPRGTTIPETHPLLPHTPNPSAGDWHPYHLPLVHMPISLQRTSLPLLHPEANQRTTVLASVTGLRIHTCGAALCNCGGGALHKGTRPWGLGLRSVSQSKLLRCKSQSFCRFCGEGNTFLQPVEQRSAA